MLPRHFIMLLAVFVIGYVFHAYFPQIGAKVGLPS